jgi:hypothetical protein
MAIVGWLAAATAVGLHGAAWRGAPLAGPALVALAVAFVLAAVTLLGVVLDVQARTTGGEAVGALLHDRLPRVGRWALGLGFVYLALNVLAALPVGGGTGEGFSFDRTFTALTAWFAAAAALYHGGRSGRG